MLVDATADALLHLEDDLNLGTAVARGRKSVGRCTGRPRIGPGGSVFVGAQPFEQVEQAAGALPAVDSVVRTRPSPFPFIATKQLAPHASGH